MPSKTTDTATTASKARRSSTQKYIRNLYGSPLGLRVSKDDRIELRPRGQRGDLVPVSKEQISKLAPNIDFMVELISEAEAARVITSQTNNQQSYHPALIALRDPLGGEYDQDDVELGVDPQDEGETVAYLKDGDIVTERIPGKGQQMVRNPPRQLGPQIIGNLPGSDAIFAAEMAADDASKDGQTVDEVLGGFDVER